MLKIGNLSKALKQFFNETAEAISISSGFIKRRRKLTGSSFVKALILGNMSNSNCSIEGMSQLLLEEGIEISKQGLDFRFTADAVKFMEKMYEESLALFQSKLQLDCSILQQFKAVKLLDSTHIILPNNMADQYRGYGSSYPDRGSYDEAAIKLQTIFDYLNQVIVRLDLKEGIRSDQGYRDYLSSILANDLLIADLGYFVPACFKQINEKEAYFISRYKADTNIYDTVTEQKLELLDLLDNQSFLTREVLLGKEAKLKVRIICQKLTLEQSARRKRKAIHLARSRGYTSSKRNQQLLNWGIFITNIPEDKINAKQILTIYRIRWQIELLFKLYKSAIGINNLKGVVTSARLLCDLYAKLCIALIFQSIASYTRLAKDTEISLTKAFLELRRRSRELLLVLNGSIYKIKNYLKNLLLAWAKFSVKDKYRKGRLSTLNILKSHSFSLT